MVSTAKIGPKADELAKWAAASIGVALPLSTALDGILLALVALFWLLGGRFREKFTAIRKNPVALAALLMCAITLLGLFYGPAGRGAFSDLKTLLLIPLLITLFEEERIRRYAWWGFLASMMLTLLLSYLIFFHWIPDIQAARLKPVRPGTVLIGSIAQNFLMAFAVFLLAMKARFAETRLRRALFALLGVLAAINVLLMVPSRTGQVVLLALMGFFLFEWLRWKGVVAAGLLIALVGGAIYMMPSSAVHVRISQLFQEYGEWRPDRAASLDSSTGLRMEFYQNSLQIIRENPLLGVGGGGFAGAYRKQVRNTPMVATENPHNQYLLTAVELGLIGLGLLLFLFAVQWRMTASLACRRDRSLGYAMLLAVITGCLFNSFLADHAEGLFYVWTTGLLYAGLSSARDKEAAS